MWIARNKDGSFSISFSELVRGHIYGTCPTDDEGNIVDDVWVHADGSTPDIIQLQLFPELKWEDTPMEVVIIPKNFENKEYPDSIKLTRYYQDINKEKQWFMSMLDHQEQYKTRSLKEKEKLWESHKQLEVFEDEISSIVQDDNSTLIYYIIRHPKAQIQYDRVVETKEEIEKYFGKEF